METLSISSPANLSSIRPVVKSSAEEDKSPQFAEDFFRLADRNVNADNVKQSDSSSEFQGPVFNSPESFSSLLEQANTVIKQRGANLMFEIDPDMNRPVLFIKDAETKEVIRQVPSDSYLDLSQKITDYLERLAAGSMRNEATSAVGLLTTVVA